MKLWCFDDGNKAFQTGRAIRERARARGWDCRLFRGADQVDDGHAFMRIEQWPPGLQYSKAVAARLTFRPEVTLIPSPKQIYWYESKLSQARDLAPWMPRTFVVPKPELAGAALAELGLPLVSKSTDGSGSSNVRILKTKEEAAAEVRAVFAGPGIPIKIGGGQKESQMQRGYLLWQKFLSGNDYQYRVGVCGRFGWMFRLHNRPETGKASGNAHGAVPILKLDEETRAVWHQVRKFAAITGERYCGLDLLRDPDNGKWLILETTLAWGMNHPNCTAGSAILAEDGTPTGRLGKDLFETLLDEIDAGIFLC